jgi:uncharacterized membrane protein
MIIDVPSRERGLQVLDRVEEVADRRNVAVRDKALVYRAEDGRPRIRQTREVPTNRVPMRGAGLGALLGLVGTPVTAGTVTEAVAAEAAIDDRLIRRVAQHIDESKAAVVLLGDDAAIDLLSGATDLAEHDIEYVELEVETQGASEDPPGFTRYG